MQIFEIDVLVDAFELHMTDFPMSNQLIGKTINQVLPTLMQVTGFSKQY